MNTDAVGRLASYVEALYPIIYINNFDFRAIDRTIAQIDPEVHCFEFNNALGQVNFQTKASMNQCDLEHFLRLTMEEGFEHPAFFILKDVHNSLNDPVIIALLKRIAEWNMYSDYNGTVFIESEILTIPKELENYITIFDVPLPTDEEITQTIKQFTDNYGIDIESDVVDDIALSFKGLNEFQIEQILNLAYQNGGTIGREDKELILREKGQLIKKSGMLELVNFSETLRDIGGLEVLKEWLKQKAVIFANMERALKFHVDIPKGILIVGMPGCGKSLTAKATASLFNLPLVRLDVGRLLGKYVGESESNMRQALALAEAISPCVLWVDEIEKAFAGAGANDGNEVTTRLFGQFLTWMQEKKSTVFIVATANDVTHLPPEFLRKGRFDELFFVDLPNVAERQKILEIHLKKRHKWTPGINTAVLAEQTDGFNGADLESIVKDTIERTFVEHLKQQELKHYSDPGEDKNVVITTAELQKAIKKTKSIKDTLGSKFEEIQKKIREMDITNASRTTNAKR